MKFNVTLSMVIEADDQAEASSLADEMACHLIDTCNDENRIVDDRLEWEAQPAKDKA